MRRAIVLTLSLAAASHGLVAARQQTAPPPSATMMDARVRLLPSDATFRVPDDVRLGPQTTLFSVYTTAADLARIRRPSPTDEWDGPYSSIANAAIPFEACVIHIGTEPFGSTGRSFGDLQFRVYVADGPSRPILDRILSDGLRQAKDVEKFTDAAATLPGSSAPWTLARIAYTMRRADYSASARLDFHTREFGQKTVVFLFMYAPSARSQWEPAIAQILASFLWPRLTPSA
jgi:hypothetical protein